MGILVGVTAFLVNRKLYNIIDRVIKIGYNRASSMKVSQCHHEYSPVDKSDASLRKVIVRI